MEQDGEGKSLMTSAPKEAKGITHTLTWEVDEACSQMVSGHHGGKKQNF